MEITKRTSPKLMAVVGAILACSCFAGAAIISLNVLNNYDNVKPVSEYVSLEFQELQIIPDGGRDYPMNPDSLPVSYSMDAGVHYYKGIFVDSTINVPDGETKLTMSITNLVTDQTLEVELITVRFSTNINDASPTWNPITLTPDSVVIGGATHNLLKGDLVNPMPEIVSGVGLLYGFEITYNNTPLQGDGNYQVSIWAEDLV